jgi:glycosyltransferase involved in cell wall biosynthesis
MHNESAAVGAFLDSVEKAFTGLAFSWELIAVDDGSTDDTWRLLTDAAPSHPWLNGIRLARRFGQHPATIAGLEASRGEVVAVMDADMQVSAADVRRAVEMISPDVELVYAAREHSAEGFMRGVLGAWLSRLAARLLSHSAECPVSTFFAATRRVVERALEIERPRPVVPYHVMLARPRGVSWIDAENRPRSAGESSYNIVSLSGLCLKIFYGYTPLPRIVAGVLTAAGLAATFFVRATAGRAGEGAWTAELIGIFAAGAALLALGALVFGADGFYRRPRRDALFLVADAF